MHRGDLFDQLLALQHLAVAPHDAELAVVRQQLSALLKSPEVKLGPLELLEKKWEALHKKHDGQDQLPGSADGLNGVGNAQSGHDGIPNRGGISGRCRDADARSRDADSRWERLAIAIRPDNQLCFDVLHEGAPLVQSCLPRRRDCLAARSNAGARTCGNCSAVWSRKDLTTESGWKISFPKRRSKSSWSRLQMRSLPRRKLTVIRKKT